MATDTSAASDVSSALAPNVSEFLATQCPVKPGGLRISTPVGADLVKLTLNDPRARCNDGSPAIAYVRAATDAARSKRWALHLQAGGNCASHDDCRDRWCGDQGVYDAAKMSSRWAQPTIGGAGLFRREAGNAPGQWNQVYVYYCTSDSWIGQGDIELTSAAGEVYSLHARGHHVIDALLQALDAGARSDDGTVVLPKLVDAEQILWTGASAGSTGASHHLDWVAERYPEATVLGVFDAGLSANADGFSAEVQAAALAHVAEGLTTFFEPASAFYDASCLAAHPTDRAVCADMNFVKRNHVTTPFFQRLDLRDPSGSKGLISLGATMAEWSAAAKAALSAVATAKSTAAESTALSRAPGVYGPSCGQHIGLMDDDWYDGATVADEQGATHTFRDGLLAWIGGADVHVVDTVPQTRSTCAATTDDQ